MSHRRVHPGWPRKQLSAVKFVGGRRFISECAGNWRDEEGQFGIYHMLAGTAQQQWEVYLICQGGDACTCNDRLCLGEFADLRDTAFSFLELVLRLGGREATPSAATVFAEPVQD